MWILAVLSLFVVLDRDTDHRIVLPFGILYRDLVLADDGRAARAHTRPLGQPRLPSMKAVALGRRRSRVPRRSANRSPGATDRLLLTDGRNTASGRRAVGALPYAGPLARPSIRTGVGGRRVRRLGTVRDPVAHCDRPVRRDHGRRVRCCLSAAILTKHVAIPVPRSGRVCRCSSCVTVDVSAISHCFGREPSTSVAAIVTVDATANVRSSRRTCSEACPSSDPCDGAYFDRRPVQKLTGPSPRGLDRGFGRRRRRGSTEQRASPIVDAMHSARNRRRTADGERDADPGMRRPMKTRPARR